MDKRRKFSREFKLAAVKKVMEQGLSYTVVGRDLGVGDNLIRNWKKSFEEDGTLATDVAGNQSVEAELKRLREENRQLKMERDILKKATAFFAKTIACNGWPDKGVIDKSGSNAAGLFNMNCLLVMNSWCWLIDVLQVKYLNNIIEQDHRFIKKIPRPMQTFKSFNSAAATLAGIEVAHMIRKGQFNRPAKSGFEQFAEFAG